MGTFPCKGGGLNDYVYVFTSRANPEHWRRLLGVIGREDLVGDARYDSPEARGQHADEVNAMIAAWTNQHTKHEAMEIIGAAGVPAGAVLDTMELYHDKTFEQRNIMQTVQHPQNGAFKMPAWPVRFSGSPPPVKPAPLLGENTGDVLSHWLGLADDEVGELRNTGVVG
jgi:formyl-CoA transferase